MNVEIEYDQRAGHEFDMPSLVGVPRTAAEQYLFARAEALGDTSLDDGSGAIHNQQQFLQHNHLTLWLNDQH
jgi:hypothetical protein